MTWEPCGRIFRIVTIAAQPDENVMQYLAYSSAARHSSSEDLVGLPEGYYIKLNTASSVVELRIELSWTLLSICSRQMDWHIDASMHRVWFLATMDSLGTESRMGSTDVLRFFIISVHIKKILFIY